jgi:hypothetical protein
MEEPPVDDADAAPAVALPSDIPDPDDVDWIVGMIVEQLKLMLAQDRVRVVDLFRTWDTNSKSHFVQKQDLYKALLELGYDATPAELDGLFKCFDKSGDGKVEYQELHVRRPLAARCARHSPVAAAARRIFWFAARRCAL